MVRNSSRHARARSRPTNKQARSRSCVLGRYGRYSTVQYVWLVARRGGRCSAVLAIKADSDGSAPPSRSRLRAQVAASNTLWVGYSSGKLRVFVLDVNALAKEQVGPGPLGPLGPPFCYCINQSPFIRRSFRSRRFVLLLSQRPWCCERLCLCAPRAGVGLCISPCVGCCACKRLRLRVAERAPARRRPVCLCRYKSLRYRPACAAAASSLRACPSPAHPACAPVAR
jgi:hypothetical protein